MKHLPLIVLALGLSGCGISDRLGLGSDATAENLPYRAALAASENKHDISVTVTAPVGTTVEQVRESVRYQATRHCLESFGNSDADWQIDPASGDWAFARTEEAMTFTARCEGRV